MTPRLTGILRIVRVMILNRSMMILTWGCLEVFHHHRPPHLIKFTSINQTTLYRSWISWMPCMKISMRRVKMRTFRMDLNIQMYYQTDVPVPRALSRLADYNKPPLQKSAQVEDAQIHLNQPSGVYEVQEDDYEGHDLNPKTTIVNTPWDLPKPSTQIKFCASGSDEWCQCEVISKAGKTATGNWHYMNTKPYNAESAHFVSFKEAEWKEVIPEEPDVEEVYFGTSANSRRFDEAKAQEITKWKEFGTFVEVEDTGQPRISTKWVCTENLKGGKLVLKARLVARGFEEDKAQLRTDNPTCYKESLRLLLCILASKKWKLQSIDIKSAYLQGNNISRSIFLQPPDCSNSKKLWKLVKTPYGLVDARRQWYTCTVKLFISLGAVQAKCVRAVFIWKDPSDSGPCGVLVSHMDDFLCGGNSFFLNIILPKIRAAFQIGLEESNNMKYLGLHVSQIPQSINRSLDNYASSLTEIDTSGGGVNKKQMLTCDQIRNFKQVVGQINWVATQARPDIVFDSCVMSNSASESTVADLHGINKVVRKVRGQPVSLFFFQWLWSELLSTRMPALQIYRIKDPRVVSSWMVKDCMHLWRGKASVANELLTIHYLLSVWKQWRQQKLAFCWELDWRKCFVCLLTA